MRLAGALLKTKQPFARFQLALIAAVFVSTGALVTSHVLAADATMSLVPSTTKVNIGDTVSVQIRENSGTDPVNATLADLEFDPALLQYVSVSDAGTAFTLVAANQIAPGDLHFARGVAGGMAPVTGEHLITTITLKALKAGSVDIMIGSDAAVVRSTDSVDILASKNPATLQLADTSAPTVPASLATPVVGFTSVALTWAASTDNVGVTGYRVYCNGFEVGKPTEAKFTAEGLHPGTAYMFTVSAEDAAGNLSAQSTAIAAHTPADTVAPSRPGIPTVLAQSSVSITLTWGASTDNVGVTGYEVYRNGALIATQDTEALSDASGSPDAQMTIFENRMTDPGLAPDTTYSYAVKAVDYTNNKSVLSPVGKLKTLADGADPSVPQGLSGTVSGTSIELTWFVSADDSGVAGYVVYRDGTQIASVPQPKYTSLSAAAGSHAYTVAAVDIVGNKSQPSAPITLVVVGQGDVNHDGNVNVFDLSLLLGEWGKIGANVCDLNGDSVVNVLDLSLLLAHWSG